MNSYTTTYFKNNPTIDANAISILPKPYHDTPVTVIKDKNERGNTWFELSILFERFEVLITGGIVCEATSRKSTPFLGSSIPFAEIRSSRLKTTRDILASQKRIAFRVQERNLRNWMKHLSHLQWTFISIRLHDKGFCTVSLLNIKNSSNKFVNLISFILSCLLRNIYSGRNYKKTVSLLSEIQFSILPTEEVTNVARKQKISDSTPNYDLSIINILVELEKNKNKPPKSVIKPETVILLSSKLNSYCKSLFLLSIKLPCQPVIWSCALSPLILFYQIFIIFYALSFPFKLTNIFGEITLIMAY